MSKLRFVSALAVVAALSATAAQAQATRTWVSGVGDDANPCSRTAPCKTFAGAISKTAAGGEISVLDPGGFGAVTITKSITINGYAQISGITAAGTNGIIVNAAAADQVVLRNLAINGVGSGLDGIRYLAGKSLWVQDCHISGFTGDGIEVAGTAAVNLFVSNTTINKTGTSGVAGTAAVKVSTTAGLALAVLENVQLLGNLNGVNASTNGRVTISNSNVSSNTVNALFASTGTSLINAESNVLAFNEGAAVRTEVAGAAARLSNNSIFNNTNGILITGGTVLSAVNNRVAGNGASANPNGANIPVQ